MQYSLLLIKLIQNVVRPPDEVHIEGGDVMLWNDYIFIGTLQRSDYKDYITARTNLEGVQFIKDLFPNKIVKEFDLVKSKLEARDNALHLDCCFQPVGNDKAIIYKMVLEKRQIIALVDLLKRKFISYHKRRNVHMNSNVFSIDSNVVVSGKTLLD
jgi:N-dimethylarginine dimethylaminohydrolase